MPLNESDQVWAWDFGVCVAHTHPKVPGVSLPGPNASQAHDS